MKNTKTTTSKKLSKSALKKLLKESLINESVDLETAQEELTLDLQNVFAEAMDQGLSKKEILDAVRYAMSYVEMMYTPSSRA